MTAMRKELLNSRSVRLEGLGTFTMKACTQGHGVDQEEEVSPNQVAALRCLFTPEYTRPAAIGTTRALLQGVEFQKVSAIGGAINGGSGSGRYLWMIRQPIKFIADIIIIDNGRRIKSMKKTGWNIILKLLLLWQVL